MHDVKVKEAVDKLSKMDMGIHYLIIYSNIQTLRNFYFEYAERQIEEKNEYVLINHFYETISSVRKALYKDSLLKEFKYKKEDQEEDVLLILDAFNTYFGQTLSDVPFNEKMINYAKKMGKRGISIMNEIGPFPFKGLFEKRIIEYELSLPFVFNIPLKLFCLFYQEDFDGFSFGHKQKLMEHHGMTMRIKE
jgi:hypothetical protein